LSLKFSEFILLPFGSKGAQNILLHQRLHQNFHQSFDWKSSVTAGGCMRPFYLDKRPNGYYRLRVVDQATGEYSIVKSTHKKDYSEALAVVLDWQKNGYPEGRVNARKKVSVKNSAPVFSVSASVPMNVDTLDTENATDLLLRLARKLGVSVVLPSAQPHPETETTPPALSDFESGSFSEYLCDFWTPKKSLYIQERRSHGHGCTERYCDDMRRIAEGRFVPYFGSMKIADISEDVLNRFFMELRDGQKLAAATVNKSIVCAQVALEFAKRKRWIASSPAAGIEKFSAEQRDRGIPTDEEVSKLFRLDWHDPVSKMANMLAAFCGMRIAEIQALRFCDVEEHVIHIRHGYNSLDRLKCTKNGKVRDVPVPVEISRALRAHAEKSPFYNGDDSFVFFSRKVSTDTPLVTNVFDDALRVAYVQIGISEESRKNRNLVFHSWRHYYATKLSERVKLEQAQQALGHLTPEMTQHYADHKTKESFDMLRKAMDENYKYILNFPAEVSA
jgi:integrase